jgi:hypothetical protein
MQVSEKNSV